MTTATRSSAGAYLFATATNSPARQIPGDGARRVFEKAFVLAVRLRFKPETPLAAITASVALAARRHPELGVPVREAEMLIREALGERVPTAGITPAQLVTVHVLMFAVLIDEMALTDDELAELIADAETA